MKNFFLLLLLLFALNAKGQKGSELPISTNVDGSRLIGFENINGIWVNRSYPTYIISGKTRIDSIVNVLVNGRLCTGFKIKKHRNRIK